VKRGVFFVTALLLALGIVFSALSPGVLRADEIEELQQQIDELENLKKMSEAATTPLEEEVENLEQRIRNARASIAAAKLQAEQRGEDVAVQFTLLSGRVAQQYKRSRTFSPIMLLFTSDSASELTKNLFYSSSVQAQDNRMIREFSEEITKLEQDQKTLAALENQLESQATFFEGEIAKARSYQQTLQGQIAALTAQQQAILSARSGTYTTSVGDVPLADDFNASIGYKSKAPSNSFAVFSFGAYTHRNGMSQYGAKEQAEDGKDYEEIIEWYYGHDVKKDDGMSSSIEVQGHGTMDYQKYLYGIAEMPSSWDEEALKAQAVAARSYARRASKPICTTEACQVFSKSKSDNPPSAWKKAVDETNKEIIDGDVSAQYSSTAGGYLNTRGWDTTDGKGSGDWTTRAWESKANSPWFYKSWYRSGYSASGASCNRSHPWLSEAEFADIINAWVVRYKETGGVDQGRILPITINDCSVGGGGGNPYSMSELRDKGGVSSVSSVSVTHTGNGQTSNVRVSTNKGTLNIPGDQFKSAYNLRAPGYLRIPQSGFAFFNIEHKD
jgi:peptidoglycan hydrolase-like amidase